METNALVIIIGTLFTLALILSGWLIIGLAQRKKTEVQNTYNKLQLVRQQEISRNTLLTQEKERQRIGLELHDDLGPTFAAIGVNLKRIRTFIKKEDFTMADEISKETSLALKEAVSNFSEISRVLYPVIFNR